MTAIRNIAAILILTTMIALSASAQRRITPVQPRTGTAGAPAPETEKEKPALEERRDAAGNIVLIDTVTGLEWVDTTAVVKQTKMIYPLAHSVSVGVNIWDPVMRMFGQKYGGFDVWAEFNMHNRYIPVVEFGMSSCNDTPEEMNFTFKSPLAPYVRIGMNYNIFYNSNPNYQFTVGVRYGFTRYTYQVTGVTVNDPYWGETTSFDLPKTSTTAGFFELTAGVKVMIFKPISLGWNVKYHSILHEGAAPYGKPMYIPGYGKRGNNFSASFSIIYTLPLNKKRAEEVNKTND